MRWYVSAVGASGAGPSASEGRSGAHGKPAIADELSWKAMIEFLLHSGDCSSDGNAESGGHSNT